MSSAALAPIAVYEILSRHLAPMLPGTAILPLPIQTDSEAITKINNPNEIWVKPDPNWEYVYRLQRSHPYDRDDIQIVEKFVLALREKLGAAGRPYFSYLIEKCSVDVVLTSIQPKIADDSLLPNIIGLLRKWASETYEGQRISVAIGVDPYAVSGKISNVHLSQIAHQDIAKVLSNGMDTLIVLSPSGHFVEHIAICSSSVPKNEDIHFESHNIPRRYGAIASWSEKSRVALTLNRQGEILVFKNRQLRFAFRRGIWSHFAHSAMIARMGSPTALIRSVYDTCLDVSFARTGGCIAIVDAKSVSKARQFLGPEDNLLKPVGHKANLLKHLVGKTFTDLPRSIREELAAIDGAVLVRHDGVVLSVGAIVKIDGGSDGGGRKAAAKALSRLGLAIKISADGGITAYTNRGTLTNPEIAFEICL